MCSVPPRSKLYLYKMPQGLGALFCSAGTEPDFWPDCSLLLHSPCCCQQAEMGSFCALNFCIVCSLPHPFRIFHHGELKQELCIQD